jgi:hypothetical protein
MNDVFWSKRQERDNTEKFMDHVREVAERGDNQ